MRSDKLVSIDKLEIDMSLVKPEKVYTQECIKKVKELYPGNEKLHQIIEHGGFISKTAFPCLDDDISIDEILEADSLEALKAKVNIIEAKREFQSNLVCGFYFCKELRRQVTREWTESYVCFLTVSMKINRRRRKRKIEWKTNIIDLFCCYVTYYSNIDNKGKQQGRIFCRE